MDFRFLGQIPFREILPWVLPPLLGALIGYLTNAVAIRMLFRPLSEIRFLGIRLPLTPGIIPRQRYQLAESIGRMVSRELLTEEAVRAQLASEGFRSKLEQNIDSLLGDITTTPLRKLQGGNQELVFASVEGFLSEGLHSFFSSRSFIHAVRTILTRVVRSLGGRRMEELFAPRAAASFAAQRLVLLLSQPENRGRIVIALEEWLQRQRQGGSTLGSIVSEELAEALAEALATLLPTALDSTFLWLEREDTRAELNERGKELLRTVLEKLNMLQRFLISAGQFDRTLEQKMPEIVEEGLDALRRYAYDPQTLGELKNLLRRTFARLRRDSCAELFAKIRPGLAGELVGQLLSRLNGQEGRDLLARGIERVMARIQHLSVGEILVRYLRIPEQDAVDFVSNQALGFLSRKETSQAIAAEAVSFSRQFMEEHARENIAEVLHIEPELKRRASAYLCAQLIRIVDDRLPAFIEGFDVHRLVVEKINSLDAAQVEKLLLMVIQKQLRWINVFGGILGAVIGFSQLLLRLLS